MVTYEEETLAKLGISLQDLELFVSRSKAGQYLLVAGIALLIYDWFCTAEDEWNYMWKQKPRLRTVKVLFALNRYLPLFTLSARFSVFSRAIHNPLVRPGCYLFRSPLMLMSNDLSHAAFRRYSSCLDAIPDSISPSTHSTRIRNSRVTGSPISRRPSSGTIKDCNFRLLSTTGFTGVINVAVVEIILLLRVWVIYSRNKWVGIALWSFYAVALALALAVKYLQPHTNLPFVRPPSYGENGCSKPAPGEMFFIYGIVCIAESIFFSMLIYKAWEKSRSAARTPILTALLKQGTFYYFIVLMILAVTMLAPFAGGMYFPLANGLIIVPITSVACTRLVLSLRGMVTSQEVVRGSQMGLSNSRIGASSSNSHSRGLSGGVGSGGGMVVLPRGAGAGVVITGTGSRSSVFPSSNTQSHSSGQTKSHQSTTDNDAIALHTKTKEDFMEEENDKDEEYALPTLNHAYTNRLHTPEDEERRGALYPPQRTLSPHTPMRRLSWTQKNTPMPPSAPVHIHRQTTVTIFEDNNAYEATGRRFNDVGSGTRPLQTRRSNSASGDIGQGSLLGSSANGGRSNSSEVYSSQRRPATADTGRSRQRERDMLEYHEPVSIHPLMPSPRLS
ncbi:SubName: Full=Uncharacterized protein {ECO:0000313/EMBL:CCA73187.1} [Serendipita indica DSM 11827]|nr:SubName: Full=Uncharacterized protein {ECO:0000313/EMBL:CCA73187.1} [Serendipita indica DSM 11827]